MWLQAKPPATLSCKCSVDSAHTPAHVLALGGCVMLWTNNEVLCGWSGSGNLLSALMFLLITVAFLRNWQITSYLAWWTNLLSFLLSLSPFPFFSTLMRSTHIKKESKDPHWGLECDLSSKAKICPRKFQPKWETGTENTTCLRINCWKTFAI